MYFSLFLNLNQVREWLLRFYATIIPTHFGKASFPQQRSLMYAILWNAKQKCQCHVIWFSKCPASVKIPSDFLLPFTMLFAIMRAQKTLYICNATDKSFFISLFLIGSQHRDRNFQTTLFFSNWVSSLVSSDALILLFFSGIFVNVGPWGRASISLQQQSISVKRYSEVNGNNIINNHQFIVNSNSFANFPRLLETDASLRDNLLQLQRNKWSFKDIINDHQFIINRNSFVNHSRLLDFVASVRDSISQMIILR